MNAGQRDRLINIEKATAAQDSEAGEETLTWGPFASAVWANVKQPQGTENFTAEQRVAMVDAIFNIRFRSDVTPTETFRVVYQGRYFDIKAVLEPVAAPRRSELELYGYARAEGLPG